MDEAPWLRKAAAANRQTGVLTCRAQGSPNITFTWRRQTGEWAGGSKYQVQHRMIIIIIITRPMPPYGRQGLA